MVAVIVVTVVVVVLTRVAVLVSSSSSSRGVVFSTRLLGGVAAFLFEIRRGHERGCLVLAILRQDR